MLSLLMFYFIIALFLFYSLTHKEPIKWMKILNVLSLNQYVRREDEPCHIPGPLQLPIIGTKWNLWFMKMNKLHEYYEQLNRKYGNVVMEMQGNIPIVSLFKREDIDTVLKHPSRYPFRPPTEIISFYRKSRPDRYSSVGLVNAQGKEWAHIRAHVVPNALQNRLFLANFSSELCDISDDFIRKVRSQRDSDNVMENVHLALKSMSFECACCLMLGRRFDQIGVENFDELTKAANNIFTCMRDAYYGNGLWKYLPSKTLRTFARSEELLYDTVSKIIAKTLQEDNLENKDVRKSVMYSILNSEGLDDRDKITGIIDFITAGIELLSHSVSFILYYLTINPEAQQKILEETADMSEVLTQDDFCRAHYTKAAIHEAFRISPSAFAIARILEKDFNLSGHVVKAGTVVLCQNFVATNKEENFENASEYKPERWMTESGEFNKHLGKGSSLVLPFGSGKRICPGSKFVELQLMVLVIKLVRSFKIKYHSDFEKQFEFILVPKSPVHVQFCDR